MECSVVESQSWEPVAVQQSMRLENADSSIKDRSTMELKVEQASSKSPGQGTPVPLRNSWNMPSYVNVVLSEASCIISSKAEFVEGLAWILKQCWRDSKPLMKDVELRVRKTSGPPSKEHKTCDCINIDMFGEEKNQLTSRKSKPLEQGSLRPSIKLCHSEQWWECCGPSIAQINISTAALWCTTESLSE